MPDEMKKRAAVETVGAVLPYAKGGGWIGIAVMMFLQYQQTQTAQTKASAGTEQAKTVTTREAELRTAAGAMYRHLSWEIDDCHRRVDEMERDHHGMIEDFNTHQHDRSGRGAVAESFHRPMADDHVDVGPVRVRRSTLRRTSDALRKPGAVHDDERHTDAFFDDLE